MYELVIHVKPVAASEEPLELIPEVEVAFELGEITKKQRDAIIKEAHLWHDQKNTPSGWTPERWKQLLAEHPYINTTSLEAAREDVNYYSMASRDMVPRERRKSPTDARTTAHI